MKKQKLKSPLTVLLMVLFCIFATLSLARRSPAHQFQEGIDLMETKGNYPAAIRIFEELSKGQDRSLAARALFHLGLCYEKLGKEEAQKAYRRLISEFTDQKELVTEARVRLAALAEPARSAEPAALAIRRVWVVPIERDIEGAVSSDGRYVPLDDEVTGDLVVRDLISGEDIRLTHNQVPREHGGHGDADISPDTKWIAYSWHNPDGSTELRVSALADGAEPRLLYHHQDVVDIDPQAWTPDGTQILARFERADGTWQIVMVSVADGSVRVLKSLGWWDSPNSHLSPDGRWIAYDREPEEGVDEEDIFLLAADGSSEVPLVEHPADDDMIGWTPDGKGVLFQSNRAGSEDLWLIRMADGKPQGSPALLRKNVGAITGRGMTEKGALYYTTSVRVRDVYLATLDPITSKMGRPKPFPQDFVGDVPSLDWSPDGKYMAYQSQTGRSGRIVVRSLETGEDRELLPNVRLPFLYGGAELSWSPDGGAILFIGGDDREGVYQVRPETGDTTPIVHADRGFRILGPVWSPDGRKVFYVLFTYSRNENGRILVRDLATGRETELYREEEGAFENPNTFIGPPAISPDGRLLAFGAPHFPGTGAAALKVIPAAGGEPRELVRFASPEELVRRGMNFRPGSLAWTPDGRYLLFEKGDYEKTELWRISVDGGEPEKLGETEGVRRARLHPDGRQITFTAVQGMNELWVMENFLPPVTSNQ
ncbi:tetratricopeptide repeat protein [Acidobacteria bacterium AH-259-L09]|nr:tetratricopeptide repeat protein [Acidobacteria bacterium AH-259-L09]